MDKRINHVFHKHLYIAVSLDIAVSVVTGDCKDTYSAPVAKYKNTLKTQTKLCPLCHTLDNFRKLFGWHFPQGRDKTTMFVCI